MQLKCKYLQWMKKFGPFMTIKFTCKDSYTIKCYIIVDIKKSLPIFDLTLLSFSNSCSSFTLFLLFQKIIHFSFDLILSFTKSTILGLNKKVSI